MINYLYLNLIYLIIMVIMVLIGVAFLTLLERKILGYIQFRKGPNKVGLKGLFQPFSDAIKLFSKEFFLLSKINIFFYLISPLLMLVISMMYWILMPFYINIFEMNYGFIFMLMLLSLSIYPIMFSGWSSNSIYSMMGCLRSIAQSISFEVSLFLMLFLIFMFIESFSLKDLFKMQFNIKFIFIFFPIYLMFMLSMLIELNRVPFDLIEGESELVSGFNIEYFSSNFSLIFMAEYLGILFMMMLISMIFFNFGYSMFMILIMLFHVYLVIWIRSILPRIRYDELMYMCWKKFLLITLIYFFLIYMIKMLMIYLL